MISQGTELWVVREFLYPDVDGVRLYGCSAPALVVGWSPDADEETLAPWILLFGREAPEPFLWVKKEPTDVAHYAINEKAAQFIYNDIRLGHARLNRMAIPGDKGTE